MIATPTLQKTIPIVFPTAASIIPNSTV
jgi:hypothetical protein